MFLQERADNGTLERIRDSSSFQGSVDDVCDEWKESRKTVGVERSWKGIKFAGFESHGPDCFEEFFL